jgi:phosphatidylserine decarboxylase
MNEQLIVFMQYILPKHWITRVYGLLATITYPTIKNYFIRKFIRKFHVNMQEAEFPNPDDYKDFHAFFHVICARVFERLILMQTAWPLQWMAV